MASSFREAAARGRAQGYGNQNVQYNEDGSFKRDKNSGIEMARNRQAQANYVGNTPTPNPYYQGPAWNPSDADRREAAAQAEKDALKEALYERFLAARQAQEAPTYGGSYPVIQEQTHAEPQQTADGYILDYNHEPEDYVPYVPSQKQTRGDMPTWPELFPNW